MMVLDVGHNEDGIKQIVRQIELPIMKTCTSSSDLVKDKEIDKMLSLASETCILLFYQGSYSRGPSRKISWSKMACGRLNGKTYPQLNDAFRLPWLMHSRRDLIVFVEVYL